MFSNRKFYNTDAVEAPAAAESTLTPSIAELMATKGTVNSYNNMVAAPIDIASTEKQPETETPAPAAIATPDAKVEEVKTETPTPTEVKAETVTPIIAEPVKPEPTWQEVAQKQPNEVLKALGFDEVATKFLGETKEIDPTMVKLLEAYKEGKHKEYLTELSTDYSKLSAEEVMRHQLRKDYPKASERQLDVLYNKEVVDLYNLDSTDTDLLEEGKLLLEAKADRYRDSLIENQKNFLVNAYTPKAAEPDNTKVLEEQQAEANRKFNEMVKAEVDNNAVTKNIIANKVFSVGEGDTKFNFPVEPKDVLDILFDPNKFKQALWETESDAQGNVTKLLKPKTETQLLMSTVMKYGIGFVQKAIEHGISLGQKSAIAPIDNAKLPDNAVAPVSESAPKTPAAAMAKSGVISSGGR